MNATKGYTPTTPLKNLSAPGEKVISKKELEREFICRVCGHCEYELSLYNGAYVCLGCSVLFKDPAKFTQKPNE